MLKTGLSCRLTETVTPENLASQKGSGALDVYATPAMITLMEKAALRAVADELPDGDTTVGTAVNIKHSSASPLNSNIAAEATLIEIDGRRLVFEVKASDDSGEIGSGTHERFIVTSQRFMEKAEKKLKKD